VGLAKGEAGRVTLAGRDLTRLPMHRRALAGIGYLPQEPSIFRRLTVRKNFLAVLELDASLSKAAREERANQLAAEFGLGHVVDAIAETLSGGERRRAEIARSLIRAPLFMLFDEPFAGVDPINVGDLQEQIRSLRDRGLGTLITDHKFQEPLPICARPYIIAGGRILEHGTPAEIAASSRARAVYLGERFRLAQETS